MSDHDLEVFALIRQLQLRLQLHRVVDLLLNSDVTRRFGFHRACAQLERRIPDSGIRTRQLFVFGALLAETEKAVGSGTERNVSNMEKL